MDPRADRLLKETSRSFYLTLRALPRRIRGQIGQLYLMARLADTIADSPVGDAQVLLDALEAYDAAVKDRSVRAPDLEELAAIQPDPAEARLLRDVSFVISSIDSFSTSDQAHIRTCLDIIIGGQSLDLRRFSLPPGDHIIALQTDAELDDYAYRVAGCVGEFWTHVSLDHCFSREGAARELLFERAVRFGKALQLINILRDIPADLPIRRCYIPGPALAAYGLDPADLADPASMEAFRPLYAAWLDRAEAHLSEAVAYIESLPHRQFRLRASCMLPVLIGQRTLQLCREGDVLDGESRIKVLRPEIKRIGRQVMFALPFKGRSRRLLNRHRSP